MGGYDVVFRRWLILRCHKLARRWQQLRARWSEAQSDSVQDDIELLRRQYLESEQRFRALLESLPRVAVQGYDRERRVIYWNEASTRLYGYGAAEAQGQALEELIIPDPMRESVIQAHQAWVKEGIEIPAEELELQHKSGEPVPVFSHHVMLGEHTENPLMFCVDVDLSDQKRAYRELDFATRFDALTHLPNRQTFEAQLDEIIAYCRRKRVGVTLVYLDIDDFVAINDALSYEQGDRLLVELTQRLHQVVGASDIMSRLSGDEFVIACPMFQRKEVLLQLVHKIQEVLRSPFLMNGSRHQVTACLGISLYPDNGETARELIRNADVAKNRAKMDGQGSVCFFDQTFHDQLLYQHRLVDRLTKALDSGELSLHYQPQVSAASGRIENLEALLLLPSHARSGNGACAGQPGHWASQRFGLSPPPAWRRMPVLRTTPVCLLVRPVGGTEDDRQYGDGRICAPVDEVDDESRRRVCERRGREAAAGGCRTLLEPGAGA